VVNGVVDVGKENLAKPSPEYWRIIVTGD